MYERRRRLRILRKLRHLTQSADWEKTLDAWAAHLKASPQRETQAFLAELAHELKTPITILIGYLDTLVQGAWQDQKVAPTFLQKALAQAQRLTTLVQDVLFLAQIESGGWVIQTEPIHLESAVREVFAELEALAQQKNLRLELTAQERGIAVEADPAALRLILKNLIENAIRYTPDHRRIWVDWHIEGERVRLRIGDEGVGIPPEEIPRIFDRFYRVDKSRSRAHGGTGLGLTLVRELISAHQTRIEVQSQVGKGSIFTFWLPLAA